MTPSNRIVCQFSCGAASAIEVLWTYKITMAKINQDQAALEAK